MQIIACYYNAVERMCRMENKQIGLRVKQLHDALEKQANNSLREDDITMMQIAVLLAISRADEQCMTMKELEKHFSVAQPTMAGIVKRLIDKALLEQLANPEDKRVKIVRITAKGTKACSRAATSMDTAEERLLKGFTADEAESLDRLLTKALDNISVR